MPTQLRYTLVAVIVGCALVGAAVIGGVTSQGSASNGGTKKKAPESRGPALSSLTADDMYLELNIAECSSRQSPGQQPYMMLIQWSVKARPGLLKYITRANDGRYFYNGRRLDFTLERSHLDSQLQPGPVSKTMISGDWMTLSQPADNVKDSITRYRLRLRGSNIVTSHVFDRHDGSPYPHDTCQGMGRGDYFEPAAPGNSSPGSNGTPPPEGWLRPR